MLKLCMKAAGVVRNTISTILIIVKGPVSAMSVCKLTPMYNLSNTLLVGLSMEQIDTVQRFSFIALTKQTLMTL